jgi:HPt (histidine-containing phosphotransfer) domain-containing protein
MDFKRIAQELDLEEGEYMDLIKLFLDTTGPNLDTLEKSIRANDSEAASKTAHKIKGAALNLDLTEVADLAKDIELRAKNGQLAEIPSVLSALKDSVNQIRNLASQ